MKYLPFEHIIFNTNLSEQEIMRKLSDVVEPKKFRFGRNFTKDYQGSVKTNSFDINRNIIYRNSFLPNIKGTIEKNNYGTQIQVTMKLDVFVILFLTVWCLFTFLFFVMLFTKGIGDKEPKGVVLIPVVMLLFIYGLTMICFKLESQKSKEYLRKIFEAEIREE